MGCVMETCDIMIHIDESLAQIKQQELESELRSIEGVIAPRFNKPHLLVIAYDTMRTDSPALLKHVTDKGYQAQLVAL